jgi:hypothetical protein
MVRAFSLPAATALAAVAAFGQNPPVPKPSPSVAVFLDFDSAPGSVPVEAMKQEVNRILGPSGVALDWRLAGENRGDRAFDSLVVLKLTGTCKIEGWTQPDAGLATGDDVALGATAVADGRVLPFTEVRCDEVKRALAYLRPEAGARERQRAFGVALGRVVAHEFYHILARTTAHAGRGLARASESLADLVSAGPMSFREEDSTAIRKALTSQ